MCHKPLALLIECSEVKRFELEQEAITAGVSDASPFGIVFLFFIRRVYGTGIVRSHSRQYRTGIGAVCIGFSAFGRIR